MGSLGRVYGSSGTFGFAWVHTGTHRGRRVQTGLRGLTPARLGVGGFKRVPVGSLRHAYGSSGSSGLAWLHSDAPRRRRVHSGSRVFIRQRIGVIQVRVVSLGRDYGSSRSFVFALVHCPGVVWFILDLLGSLRCTQLCSGSFWHSLRCVLGSSGSFAYSWFHSRGLRCLRFHSVSRLITRAPVGVVGSFVFA